MFDGKDNWREMMTGGVVGEYDQRRRMCNNGVVGEDDCIRERLIIDQRKKRMVDGSVAIKMKRVK